MVGNAAKGTQQMHSTLDVKKNFPRNTLLKAVTSLLSLWFCAELRDAIARGWALYAHLFGCFQTGVCSYCTRWNGTEWYLHVNNQHADYWIDNFKRYDEDLTAQARRVSYAISHGGHISMNASGIHNISSLFASAPIADVVVFSSLLHQGHGF